MLQYLQRAVTISDVGDGPAGSDDALLCGVVASEALFPTLVSIVGCGLGAGESGLSCAGELVDEIVLGRLAVLAANFWISGSNSCSSSSAQLFLVAGLPLASAAGAMGSFTTGLKASSTSALSPPVVGLPSGAVGI